MQKFEEILLQNGYQKVDHRFIKEKYETSESVSVSHVAIVTPDSILLAGIRGDGDVDEYNTGHISPTTDDLLVLFRLFSV